jgi:PAS domain S-box-containing protein
MLTALVRRFWPDAGVSIRGYLVLLSVVTLAPLVVFSSLLALNQARTERAVRERAVRETARALAVAVDEHLTGALNSLRVLGTGPFFAGSAQPLALPQRMARVAPTHEGWRAVFLLSDEGQLVTGTIPEGELIGIDATTRSLLQKVRETRGPAISALVPAWGSRPDELGFLLACPVVGDKGRRYVMFAALDTSGLERILRGQVLHDGWAGVVVDPEGRIAARVPSRGHERYVGQRSALVDQTGGGMAWQRGIDREGVPSYLALQRAPVSWWGIGISVPQETINAPFRRSVLVVLASGLLCLLAGAGLAALVGRQLSRPLTALAGRAHDIERGPGRVDAPRSVIREIAVLGESLERAAQGLEERAASQQLAAAAVRETQAWHAALAAFAPVGLMRTDPQGRITYVNERWTQLTGVVGESTAGPWGDDLHPDDGLRVSGEWIQVLSEPRDFSTEFRRRDPARPSDPAGRWLAAYARPIRDVDGRVVEFIGVLVDITDRKRAEEERAELTARAQAAQREAEAASRAKDDFLAALSHELRTPLNAMLLWVQVLREAPPDASMYERALDAIERSARLQTKLVENLVDLARISSGKFTIDVGPVDLRSVVRAAVDGARDEIARKSIALALELGSEACWILGDASRLQQVLLNLLSNATRFTPKGGAIDLTVSRQGTDVAAKVRDTGEGIAPEFQAHLFERFRQADSGAGRRHGGLGLGLAIARAIMELHRGTITATSQGRGHGATFTISMPLMSGGPPALAPALVETASLDSHGRLDDVTVLLVEDDEEARELVSRTLGRLGARVQAVASAEQGLEVLRHERPQILVSDIGMPGMDGYELIRRVRDGAVEANVAIPAVAITGYASPGDRERAMAAGYQAHLAKPVDTRVLVEVITALVTAARARAG